MKHKRIFFAVALAGFFAIAEARADCVCTCVNGENQPLCTKRTFQMPVCPARICPTEIIIAPPIVEGFKPPQGTSKCTPMRVENPVTNKIEWQMICK